MGDRVWEDFDPTWLVRLAEEQWPGEPWLARALADCHRCFKRSVAYWRFVECITPNTPGSSWQFKKNIMLEHPRLGQLVLDVLQDDRIGGVEFLERVNDVD